MKIALIQCPWGDVNMPNLGVASIIFALIFKGYKQLLILNERFK